MDFRLLLVVMGLLIGGSSSLIKAALIVNSPIPLTHHVVVQPIRVKKTNGATAVVFGTPAQETYIKNEINRAWAQVGVRIDWLATVDYVNDFAYDGSPGSYGSTARPTSHLNTIVANAGSPPKSSNAVVLNLFFVEIVPGFSQTSDNTSNGLAFVDGNGVTVHVGANLPGFEGGRDVIAGVIAHEIGHNLGLSHHADPTNLMASGGNEERLTTAQKDTIFTNRSGIDGYDLLQVLTTPTNYQTWASGYALTLGPGDDEDRDGIDNVIEFMLNLHPKQFSQLPPPVRSASGLTWTLNKNAAAVADGLVYQVQTSNNLTTWFNAGAAGSGSTVLQNNSSAISVRLNFAGQRGFMRLSTTIPDNLDGAARTFIPASRDNAPRVISEPVDIRSAYP